jgi:hypothetical protein
LESVQREHLVEGPAILAGNLPYSMYTTREFTGIEGVLAVHDILPTTDTGFSADQASIVHKVGIIRAPAPILFTGVLHRPRHSPRPSGWAIGSMAIVCSQPPDGANIEHAQKSCCTVLVKTEVRWKKKVKPDAACDNSRLQVHQFYSAGPPMAGAAAASKDDSGRIVGQVFTLLDIHGVEQSYHWCSRG